MTSERFVLSIARLHQKLLDIVGHFNFCYSLQVNYFSMFNAAE